MESELGFFLLLAAVAAQRLAELSRSRSNEAWLRARGARESAPGHFRWMQGLHASWIAAMGLEVALLDTPFIVELAAVSLAGVAVGQMLRYAAMATLGRRWTVRILTLPGEPTVASGIFRYVRHPNYLGVVLELAFLPLVHGAWRTAVVASVANGALLAWRIRQEERALTRDNDYRGRLGGTPRLFPRVLLGRRTR